MHPRDLQIKNFTYELPEERIAHYPLPERDLSKLLIYKHGIIAEDHFNHISQYIPDGALLLFNNTRVIHARLFFNNTQGEKIEIFCLEPSGPGLEMSRAMAQTGAAAWNCMIGRANKWKEKILYYRDGSLNLSAEIIDKTADAFVVQFKWEPEDLTFSAMLEHAGFIPIPPYLKRQSGNIDESRYQTVYAERQGSVAAPTAGLHFSKEVIETLQAKDIESEFVTLHVGAGTFKPVKAEHMAEHVMHAELMEVDIEVIEKLCERAANKSINNTPVIAVGTTSLRTIETLYWMGLKAMVNPESSPEDLEIHQWDPYEFADNKTLPAVSDSLLALIKWMEARELNKLICHTQILIAPSYLVQIVDALITNFHQPSSTLLLLVAAIAGEDWRRIYDHALNHNFRFLSYGDSSLIWIVREKQDSL